MQTTKLISLILFLVLVNVSFSQVISFKKVNLDGGQHKTIFIYRDFDDKEELEQVVKNAWNFSEIELMSIAELTDYEFKENDLLISIGYEHIIMNNGNFVTFTLNLSVKNIQKNEYEKVVGAYLSMHGEQVLDVCRNVESEKIIGGLYFEKDNFSWNYAYLTYALAEMSNYLDGNKIKAENTNSLVQLKNEKLYVTYAVNVDQSRFTGKEKVNDKMESIQKKYPYSFDIIDTKKVNDLFLNGDLKYLYMFQKVGKGKNTIIIDVSTNELIYYDFDYNKYVFESKDIKKVSKLIRK